jgi:hypothetical protein
MQAALDSYARWFNRGRRRDGPLFRGRFVNRIIETESYLWAVLRYIDRNPVLARLAARPTDYPYGSAWHYARARGPRWLERSVIEEMLGRRPGEAWDPALYLRFEEEGPGAGSQWLVGRRLLRAARGQEDPLDDLVGAAPERVRAWMLRKARLADGTEPGLPVVSPVVLAGCIERRGPGPAESLVLGHRRVPAGEVLTAGLLRECSGLRLEEIAGRMGIGYGTVWSRVRAFREAVVGDPIFGEVAVAVLAEALAREHGGRAGGRGGAPHRILPTGRRVDPTVHHRADGLRSSGPSPAPR